MARFTLYDTATVLLGRARDLFEAASTAILRVAEVFNQRRIVLVCSSDRAGDTLLTDLEIM